jgi:hypothetical protein
MRSIGKVLMIALCLCYGGFGASSVGLAGPGIEAEAPPPPARDERSPAPRDGYVWTPGYWEWSGHAYSWVSGRFIFQRRGAHWVADRWDQVDSHWQHVAGHWEH